MTLGNEKEENEKQKLKNANDELERIAEQLADLAMQDASHNERQLLPQNVEKDRAKLEFIKTLQRSQQTLNHGFQELFKALSELAKSDETIFTSQLGKDLGEIVQFCASIDDEDVLGKYADAILEDKTLQELCAISHETMSHFYKAAAHLYTQQQYEQALAVFSVLILLNPKQPLFWLGSGNSAYFLNQYPVALQAYTMCAITNPFELRCHLYSSRCHEALGHVDQAINALDLGLIAIIDLPVDAAIRDELDKERERLVQKLNR